MTDFRESQNRAHPNKTNTLMSGIIVILICIVGIQVWLLYSALNNALEDNLNIAVASFVGSALLFVVSMFLLKYLPDPRGK
jgi:membrane protein YdbS with pleckstrin-like domain